MALPAILAWSAVKAAGRVALKKGARVASWTGLPGGGAPDMDLTPASRARVEATVGKWVDGHKRLALRRLEGIGGMIAVETRKRNMAETGGGVELRQSVRQTGEDEVTLRVQWDKASPSIRDRTERNQDAAASSVWLGFEP